MSSTKTTHLLIFLFLFFIFYFAAGLGADTVLCPDFFFLYCLFFFFLMEIRSGVTLVQRPSFFGKNKKQQKQRIWWVFTVHLKCMTTPPSTQWCYSGSVSGSLSPQYMFLSPDFLFAFLSPVVIKSSDCFCWVAYRTSLPPRSCVALFLPPPLDLHWKGQTKVLDTWAVPLADWLIDWLKMHLNLWISYCY